MEQTKTNEKEIMIKAPERLTYQMLHAEIANGISLAEFLASQCAILADGEVQLYSTYDSLFRCLAENRVLNESHVLALMESYEKDGYLFTIIFVNERLEIIDGQHRYEAARRKKLPVYFMVMPGWGIKEVTMLNMNSRNWTILDFMETHAKAGNPNYVRFKEFYDSFEFDVTVCQLIITGKRSGRIASTDTFRSGLMQVDEQLLTDAYLKANKILEMKQFHPNGWKSRNMVEAMLALFNTRGYEHDHLVLKLSTYPEVLLAKAKSLRVEEYLSIFRDKYNFRRISGKIDTARR